MPPLFGLAPGGVFRAGDVAAPAVRSCRTLSTLPAQRQAVSFLWHFPSILLRAPAGRYPAPLFRGARTFLASLAQAAAARPSGVQRYRRFRSSLREGSANCSECPLSTQSGLESLTRNSRVVRLYRPCQRAGRPRRRLVSGEESPGSTEQRCRVTPGGSFGSQGKCHRKDTARLRTGKVERVRQERTAPLATKAAR